MTKFSNTTSFSLLNAGMALHDGDWNYKEVCNPFSRLYYVLEGEASIRMNKKNIHLTPGNLYLIPPFVTHEDACSGVFRLYYFHVFENQFRKTSIFEEFELPEMVEADELTGSLVKRLLDINPGKELANYDPRLYTNETVLIRNIAHTEQEPVHQMLETRGIVFQLLSRFLAGAGRTAISNDARIWNALGYIKSNLNRRMHLSEIASACNISEDYLIRLFRKEFGKTPVEYINQKKIETAQLMLILEQTPIKNVAYSLGFENISYFNKVFRQQLGKTPTEYRSESVRAV